MTVSLDSFLRTGNLGDLRRGMSKDKVQDLLGPPDNVGLTSRKYRQPCLFLYGTVELYFSQQSPHGFSSVFWEAGDKGTFRLPTSCKIVDWTFTPDWTFDQVEDYLRDHDLFFDYCDAPSSAGSLPWLLLSSGVHVSFCDGLLYGVSNLR